MQQALLTQRQAADTCLASLEGKLEEEEVRRMSKTLSQDLGLSASMLAAIQVETMRASMDHERSAVKHQVLPCDACKMLQGPWHTWSSLI